MAAWIDGCRFTPTAGSTTDWTFSAAVTGYMSPALAGVTNGRVYKYRAESADLTQWELGEGAYNTATGVLARTTVLYNSSGTGTASGQSGAGTKINFSTVPQVAVVALKEDMISIEEANSFSAAQKAQIATNIGIIPVSYKLITFTRVMSTASGNQALTGVGFTPRLILFQTGISGGAPWCSFGQSDGATNSSSEIAANTTSLGTFSQNVAGIQREDAAGTKYNTFTVASMDADGFTVAWTKVGLPTATCSVSAICYR